MTDMKWSLELGRLDVHAVVSQRQAMIRYRGLVVSHLICMDGIKGGL